MKIKFTSLTFLFCGTFVALILHVLSLSAVDMPLPKMEIDLSQPGVKVSPAFYGLMTEEINHAYDGGLYAELIQNRKTRTVPCIGHLERLLNSPWPPLSAKSPLPDLDFFWLFVYKVTEQGQVF